MKNNYEHRKMLDSEVTSLLEIFDDYENGKINLEEAIDKTHSKYFSAKSAEAFFREMPRDNVIALKPVL